MRRRETLEIKNFKGLYTRRNPGIDPSFLYQGKNFLIDRDGTIQKIWGCRKLDITNPLGSDEVTSMDCISQQLLLICGESFHYSMGNTISPAKTIQSDPNESMQFRYSPVSFAKYLSNFYMTAGSRVWYYSPAGGGAYLESLDAKNYALYLNPPEGVGGDPANYYPIAGSCLKVHLNRLWLVTDRNLVTFTNAFTDYFYDLGPGNTVVLNAIQIGGDNSATSSVDDRITTIVPFMDRLFVGKKYSWHEIIGRDTLGFAGVPLTNQYGCQFPSSVQVTKAGVIFLDNKQKGVCVLTAEGFKNITIPRVIDIIESSTLGNSAMRSCYYRDRYYMLSLGSSTLIYDIDTDCWSQDDVPYNSFAPWEDSNVFIGNVKGSTNKQDLFQFGSDGGRYGDKNGVGEVAIPIELWSEDITCGTLAQEKTFCEMLFHVKASEQFELETWVDGRKFSKQKSSFNVGVKSGQFIANRNYGDPVISTPAKFFLPMGSTGMGLNWRINLSTKYPFEIKTLVLYFMPRGTSKQEGEH